MNMNDVMSIVYPATALTALGVGLAALGVNLVKSLHLGAFRGLFQFLAGSAGVLSLLACFGVL